MNAAVISKYGYFNQAISDYLQRRLDIAVTPLLMGFDQLEVEITSKYQTIFLLGYDIIGASVLDIGYHWGNALSQKSSVYLFDFDSPSADDSNPTVLNPLKAEFSNAINCSQRFPARKTKRGNDSFQKALQGLFRTHGHNGFLGELGKLQSFLMGGLEFYEETPHDPTIWNDFFRPAQRAVRHLVNVFETYRYLLNHWPVKETVNRLKNNIMILKDWEIYLNSRAIDNIGPREQVLDTLDIIERDIITFKI